MSNQKERAKSAILGALIADAAVNPVHWIYDGDVMKKLLETHDTPEFLSEWSCPFYKTEVGSFSCYGDQAFCLLKSIVDNKGFNVEKYAKDQYDWFGPDSKYKPNPTGKDGYPKQGPWINGSVTKSLNKLKDGNPLAGSDEAESDSFAKVIPLAALYAGKEELNDVIEKAIRTTLHNNKAVETAQAYAKLLEACILNGKLNIDEWYRALPEGEVKKEVEEVIQNKNEDHVAAAKKFGIACSLPGSFQGTIHCLLNCDNKTVTDGVRLALSPGGGNCARSMGVGAVLAAVGGSESIPKEWLEKTVAGDEMVTYTNLLSKIEL